MVEPRPTSNEDILWFRYRGQPTQAHRNDLVTHYLPAIERIARTVARKRPRVDPEDLLGSGCVGIISAIEGYDPDLGPFDRYYPGKVRHAMLSGLRIGTPLQSSSGRADPVAAGAVMFPDLFHTTTPHWYEPTDGLPIVESFDQLAHLTNGDPAEAFELAELRALLIRSIAALAPRHRAILGLRYRTQLSVEDIGKMLGCSKTWVTKLTNSAIVALRDEMRARTHPT